MLAPQNLGTDVYRTRLRFAMLFFSAEHLFPFPFLDGPSHQIAIKPLYGSSQHVQFDSPACRSHVPLPSGGRPPSCRHIGVTTICSASSFGMRSHCRLAVAATATSRYERR